MAAVNLNAIPAIALPPLNNVINLPPLPQNPPVASDIVASHIYTKEITIAHDDHAVNDNVLADALTYHLKLVQASTGAAAAPAWFHLAMQQLLDPINQRLDRLTTITTQSARLSAIAYNLQAGSGSIRPFEVVLFRDGSDPTAQPHNLPSLLNVAAISDLNPQQTRDYYRGYYHGGGILPPVERRKQLIIDAIGCKGVKLP